MTRVLVTGAGGAAGVCVVRALSRAGHQVVGGDPDPLAAGLALAEEHALLPRADDERFVPSVIDAARDHRVDAVITTVAEEMGPLELVRDSLAGDGIALWLSSAASVSSCLDKWRFARALEQAGVPAPPTVLASGPGSDPAPTSSVRGPWVVKPRYGRGSRDVYLVDEADELAWAVRRTPDAIVQTRCRGREFTADALVDRDGIVAGVVPRWRLETKAGISTKGTTFSDPRVDELVQATVLALGLEGALNLQGFVEESEMAPVQVVEVNPRFSGGLALSLEAGADLVGEFLRGTLGLPIRRDRLQHEDGVTMVRHYDEIFLRDQR
jgi:carbamoyl-phosphate synthase large subunit